MNQSKEKALKILGYVNEKQAGKPVVLELKGLTNFCDYFIVCSADNTMHVRAIYDWVIARCKEEGITLHHSEDDAQGHWMLIDLFDVVVHVFLDETREFYNLEYLWSQAKRVRAAGKKKKKNNLSY